MSLVNKPTSQGLLGYISTTAIYEATGLKEASVLPKVS